MADFDPVTYKLNPILIKSIPKEETITEGPFAGGTKYTIEFREDAKWDNGSPITGNDFLFSTKAIQPSWRKCGKLQKLFAEGK